MWAYARGRWPGKKKNVSTPTPTPVSFTRSQQTVMIIRMVLCLHPSAKKSLNAKTQTQSQKERLMSHPFYHLLILIKHSSECTLCWGPNSTSSDLYRKPPWILVFSTISEVDFQLFSSLPTRSFQNGLLCHVRISWCMYIYTNIRIHIYNMYAWSTMVQHYAKPLHFSREHCCMIGTCVGRSPVSAPKLLKRVEGKWGKASFKMEVSIARWKKRCQHRPQLWEELAQRAGGICSMCFMCEACSGSTKEVVLTLALPGGETLGSAEFLHLKSRMCFSDWNVDVECILPKWWSRVSAVECILEPRRLDQESGHRTYCFRAMSKFTQLVVLELTMLLRFTKHNNCTFYLLSTACLKQHHLQLESPKLIADKDNKKRWWKQRLNL